MMNAALPFIGREKTIARLHKLHERRRHVLILGEQGVGKTALVEHLQGAIPLLVCRRSSNFRVMAKSLNDLRALSSCRPILPRQHDLLAVLTKANKPVVFDGLGWTDLKLSSFFECVGKRRPVWLCCRSVALWDFGFYHPFLWKFSRVKLQPFELSDTRKLVEAAIQTRLFPARAADQIERLQQASGGNPRALWNLIEAFSPEQREQAASVVRKENGILAIARGS